MRRKGILSWLRQHSAARLALGAVCALCLMCAACGATATAASTAAAQKTTTNEYNALMGRLKATGWTIMPDGDAHQKFLSVPGKLVLVGGEHVEIYSYVDASLAAHDTTRIDKDACLIHTSQGSMMVDWPLPPHLYHKDHLLVIYVGSDTTLINLFVSQLGPQFAGV